MEFKVGDKIEIIKDPRVYLNGMLGVVVKRCNMASYCRKVKCSDGHVRHVHTKNLISKPTKNQQLLFNFME